MIELTSPHGRPTGGKSVKKYLVGILAFLGLVFIVAEIRRAALGDRFWYFYLDFWAEIWYYASYVMPFI